MGCCFKGRSVHGCWWGDACQDDRVGRARRGEDVSSGGLANKDACSGCSCCLFSRSRRNVCSRAAAKVAQTFATSTLGRVITVQDARNALQGRLSALLQLRTCDCWSRCAVGGSVSGQLAPSRSRSPAAGGNLPECLLLAAVLVLHQAASVRDAHLSEPAPGKGDGHTAAPRWHTQRCTSSLRSRCRTDGWGKNGTTVYCWSSIE